MTVPLRGFESGKKTTHTKKIMYIHRHENKMDLTNNKQMELTRGLGFLAFSFMMTGILRATPVLPSTYCTVFVGPAFEGAMFEKRVFSL